MTICAETRLTCRLALGAAILLGLAACTGPAPRHAPSQRVIATEPSRSPPATVATDAETERRFQEALALMKARRFDEAQAAFLALSQDAPLLSGPLTNLGILQAQNRQPAQAIDSLLRAVQAHPGNAVAHNWLGTLYRAGGDFLRAEQAYRKALAARPDYADAQLNLAILHDVALHRPHDALAGYRQYQRLAGNDDLIVTAWIREIETRLQAPPSAGRTTVAGVTR